MADYKVGYGKPPTDTRFKKGQSGNPKGRKPKQKKPVDRSLAAMLKRIGEREVVVGGETFSLMELELLALQKKASTGEVNASRHLARLREEAGLLKPQTRGTHVLTVPMAVSTEVWEILTERQQRQYRETGETFTLDGLIHDPDMTGEEPRFAYEALDLEDSGN